MFPAPRIVLKPMAGTLEETPFALLLHAIDAEERSCTLELKLRNLQKNIFFEDGQLVGCESNLLHETLGKHLVEKGKLTEAQHHTVLSESISAGKPFATLLVEQQLVSPFELFKHLQANLAHRILDAFRWHDAKWKLTSAREVEAPIRMNCARLIFMGAGVMTDDAVTRHFALPPSQRVALRATGPDPRIELKLAGRELKLFHAVKARPSIAELYKTPGFTAAEVNRRLFAWAVLDILDIAENVEATPRPSPPPVAHEAPQAPLGLPFLDDDVQVLNALATEYLTFRTKDPFDLLGVPVTAEAHALQKAFLSKALLFPPVRFKSADARSKAELLLVAYGRAFGALVETETNLLHRTRRETAEAAKRQGGPRTDKAAAQFRIQTELLDAESQFAQGLKRLDAQDHQAAAQLFEYACDIEPRGRFRAHLALARYRMNPEATWTRMLEEFAAICVSEPTCEEAWAFRGEIALAWGRKAEAVEAYKHAAKLNPSNPKYTRPLG